MVARDAAQHLHGPVGTRALLVQQGQASPCSGHRYSAAPAAAGAAPPRRMHACTAQSKYTSDKSVADHSMSEALTGPRR
jgi:hypothetical protein